jgi:hypothetical protein
MVAKAKIVNSGTLENLDKKMTMVTRNPMVTLGTKVTKLCY